MDLASTVDSKDLFTAEDILVFNFVPSTIPSEDAMNLSIFYLSTRGCPEQVLISRTYSIIKEKIL